MICLSICISMFCEFSPFSCINIYDLCLDYNKKVSTFAPALREKPYQLRFI